MLQAEKETMQQTITTLKQVINGFKEQMASQINEAKQEGIKQMEKTAEEKDKLIAELQVQLAAVELEKEHYKSRLMEEGSSSSRSTSSYTSISDHCLPLQ